MAEQIHLAEPKLVPLSAAEQAEAVGLLAALLRAAIATRATVCDPAARGGSRRATTAQPAADQAAAPGRHPTGARPETGTPVAASLPPVREANGKRGSRERAGRRL